MRLDGFYSASWNSLESVSSSTNTIQLPRRLQTIQQLPIRRVIISAQLIALRSPAAIDAIAPARRLRRNYCQLPPFLLFFQFAKNNPDYTDTHLKSV